MYLLRLKQMNVQQHTYVQSFTSDLNFFNQCFLEMCFDDSLANPQNKRLH